MHRIFTCILHSFHSQSKHFYTDLCQQMSVPTSFNSRLQETIQQTAVKMLKSSISKIVRSYELNAAKMVTQLPEHHHVLREQIVRPGVTISRLYDENLGKFIKSGLLINPSRRVGLQCILTAVASGVAHLHAHNLGHFDIKPSNILINWASHRGFFTGTTVVIADFGLTRELQRGKYCMNTLLTSVYPVHKCTHVSMQAANITVTGEEPRTIYVLS